MFLILLLFLCFSLRGILKFAGIKICWKFAGNLLFLCFSLRGILKFAFKICWKICWNLWICRLVLGQVSFMCICMCECVCMDAWMYGCMDAHISVGRCTFICVRVYDHCKCTHINIHVNVCEYFWKILGGNQ